MQQQAQRRGSTDAAIRDAAPNDLAALIAGLPTLAAIAFNGATSAARGIRALTDIRPAVARITLPSSSPLHTIGLAAKLPAWLALKPYL